MSRLTTLFHRLIAVLLLPCSAFANVDPGGVSMPFVHNTGQAPAHVSYYARTPGAMVFIDQQGRVNYEIPQQEHHREGTNSILLRETMLSGTPQVKGVELQTTRFNFLRGRNPENWKKRVASFGSVSLGKVWPGIEVSVNMRPGNVEKLFQLDAGANPGLIQLEMQGQDGLSISDSGALLLATVAGAISFTAPVAWQNGPGGRESVAVSYWVDGSHYGFSLGEYDISRELIIDPLLASTYVGGGLDDYIIGVTVNTSDEVIVAGYTASANFPTTPGAFDTTRSGIYDFFALKLNEDFSMLLEATYLGGSGNEFARDVAFDAQNNIYFMGESTSADFPFPPAPYLSYQGTMDANGSIFVAAMSADLSEVVGATWLGGDVVDFGRAMETADNGNVYVTGFSNSTSYPTTPGVFDVTRQTGSNMVLSVLNPDLSVLLMSTYLGGGSGYAIALETDGSVFVAGGMNSLQEYTTTAGAFMEAPPGSLEEDAYLVHVNANLSAIVSGSFLGHIGTDVPNDLQFTAGGQLLVTGYTTSAGFPVTAAAFDDSVQIGGGAFISILSKDLTSLVASTFLDLTVDNVLLPESSGSTLIVGLTNTLDFPGGSSPSDPATNGVHMGADIAIARVNSSLSQVSHFAYIGGDQDETGANVITRDNSDNVIIAGVSNSSDVETTMGAFDPAYGGNGDGILMKITADLRLVPIEGLIFCDSFESQFGIGGCP